MKPLRFLISTLGLTAILLIGYYSIFRYQMGAVLVSESWINEVYKYKEFDLHEGDSEKDRLLIVSGSNSLFGINTDELRKLTGMPVHNLAAHAALDLDFHYYKLEQILRHGDIVVMPLELPVYFRDGYTEWFTNNMMVWEPEFFDSLSILDKVEFVRSVEVTRVLSGILSSGKFFQEASMDTLEGLPPIGKSVYSYQNLSFRNDILIDKPPTTKVKSLSEKGTNYLSDLRNKGNISSGALMKLKRINELVESRGATLILTWPVTMRNPAFNPDNRNTQIQTEFFRSQLVAQGYEIQCPWSLFNYDVEFFFNERSHLNKSGARIRTYALSECLSLIFRGQKWPFSINETNQFIEALEKFPESHLDFGVFIDFTLLRNALESYRAKHGSYPKSHGYDGIKTKWGKSGEVWISGLVPEYLPSLPRDRRYSELPQLQYLYKSDGKDYKLIQHQPPNCQLFKKATLLNVDPMRNCWAIGYWTENAKNW